MHRFELKPNCSVDAQSARLFYGSLVTVSLAVATGFALMGFWPVLPFAGLELGVLLFCVYRQILRSADRDWIEVHPSTVVIRQLRGEHEHQTEFQRGWARVELVGTKQALAPRKLIIRSSKHRCLVGEFLSESERVGLKRRLAEILA